MKALLVAAISLAAINLHAPVATAATPEANQKPAVIESVLDQWSKLPNAPVAPVGVKLKAYNDHPPTYVLGEAVKLTIDETGDVRERHWSIEPPILDMIHPDPLKKDKLWWVSTQTGEYTVTVTSVGKVAGIAQDKIKVNLITGGASAAAASTKPPTGETPEAATRRALGMVDASSREIAQLHVRDVVNSSNTLSQARGFILRPESLGPERAKAWQPFFTEIEKLFDAMRRDGKLPTEREERGAMEAVAKVMGEGL